MRISPGFCSLSNLPEVKNSRGKNGRARSGDTSDSGNKDITLVEGWDYSCLVRFFCNRKRDKSLMFSSCAKAQKRCVVNAWRVKPSFLYSLCRQPHLNFLRRSAKTIKHKSDKSFILLSCTKAQKGVRRVIPYYCALHLETVKTQLFPIFFSSIFG